MAARPRHAHGFATPVKLIAIAGKAGAGKSTAAQYLVERYGFARIRFAGPLKAMMKALGLTEAEFDGDRKETPCARLGGQTPRHAMQTLGTEWGRQMITPDLWTRIFEFDALSIIERGGRVVVDDCRFPNEAELIRKLSGKIIAIRTLDEQFGKHTHESELHELPYDVRVLNEKFGYGPLHMRLDGALEQIGVV